MPDGVPVPGASTVTVAVKVTDWPKTEVFTSDVTVEVVLACPIDCDSEPALVLKLPSPLYTASIV